MKEEELATLYGGMQNENRAGNECCRNEAENPDACIPV